MSRSQTVFGVGPLDPELCFVGEAPGADEDQRGEPFVGEAGQLLNRIIAACGMKREEVYICNICKCRPPGNRTAARAQEAGNCREYLERQLELVQPKFLCAWARCGAEPARHHARHRQAARPFPRLSGHPGDVYVSPRLPAAGRSPQKKKDVWEDMKKLLERMGRPIPRR